MNNVSAEISLGEMHPLLSRNVPHDKCQLVYFCPHEADVKHLVVRREVCASLVTYKTFKSYENLLVKRRYISKQKRLALEMNTVKKHAYRISNVNS